MRSHLLVLVLVATLPLLVFASVIVVRTLNERRQILDRGMHETAAALTAAVDGEVKASLAVLETLAASALLDAPDLESFHRLCVKVTEKRPGAYLILFDGSGAQFEDRRGLGQRPIGARQGASAFVFRRAGSGAGRGFVARGAGVRHGKLDGGHGQ